MNQKYGNNQVINSKYTKWNFLPMILVTHLKRFMNLYFIIIGCLQLWDAVSPVNPWTTWGPIFVIFGIAFMREGIDDYIQHQQDRVTNEREYYVIRDRERVSIQSQEIFPGDIVVLNRNQEAPCDMALIFSSNHDGTCCIETANLDGETNLKERIAPKETQQYGTDGFLNANLKIECPPPNSDLYMFDSRLFINNSPIPLSEVQLIQQGVFLRNVDLVYGVACYTGKRTKLGLNSQEPPVKWTQIEKVLDVTSICIFIAQIILAGINGALGNWKRSELLSIHYLHFELEDSLQKHILWMILYIRSYLLTSVMIPVSLKVTLDVCKYLYAVWIRNDAKIYDPITQTHTLVNNTSVIEDLGAVEYVFTDKTGTLTENEMRLKKLNIMDRTYGHSDHADDIFEDKTFKEDVLAINLENYQYSQLIISIMNLCLCNTIKVINTTKGVEFEGVSPEEVAFMKAMKELGIVVQQEEKIYSIKLSNNHEPLRFQILAFLPFSYARKCMSVIIRDLQNEKVLMLSKGAHERIFESCGLPKDQENPFVNQFSSQGLRVMALSFKEINAEEYSNFSREINEALNSTIKRAEKTDAVYSKYETNEILIGISAIEDKLQDGVPQTIEMMREAGIRVWMVTGDLLNTAIKIAKSTRLITNDGPIIHISSKKSLCDASTLLQGIQSYVETISSPYYLVIEGSDPSTQDILEKYPNLFSQLAKNAKCVICARTMPKQKAKYVEIIKSLKCVTMSIGDGGNDVTMLRAAHIGVGIMGREGRQAAVASDFAVTRFKHVQRLLLIHGRYAFYRTSWLTQFCFYKSILLALIQVSYMFNNGFSAVSFFNDFNLMCYNAIFTLLPVIFFLFDKDIDDISVYLHPFLYSDSQKRVFINKRTIFWWVIRAIYQAAIIVFLINYIFDLSFIDPLDGTPANLAEAQQTTYSALILIVSLTTTVDTQNFTSLNFIFIWGNWVLYLICAVIANMIYKMSITREMYLVMWRVLSSPSMWIIVLSVSAAAVLPVVFIQSIFATYLPSNTQKLRYQEVNKGSNYEPLYLVDLNNYPEGFQGDSVNPRMNPTVWEETNGIFVPLFTLCGCMNQHK